MLRKKLSMTIASVLITLIVGWLGTKNIDLAPEMQLNLTLGLAAVIGLIVGTFNIGQGIADKGKEVAKKIGTIFLMLSLSTAFLMPVQVMAQSNCDGDLMACEELLDETITNQSEMDEMILDLQLEIKKCDDKCGWVALVKDKTFMTAVLGSVVFLIGGIAGIFLVPKQ